jgi:twitching motility protein PilU
MVSKEGASDLFLTVGIPGTLKIKSTFKKIMEPVHTDHDLRELIKDFLTEEQWLEFASTLELNVALSNDEGERFRVNIFYNMRNVGLVIRHIRSKIPSTTDLGLPDIYKKFILQKRGLLLVVGSTGSGKSTTIASLLEHRNQFGDGHIVTIEDPIEFVFQHKNCIFTQREINIDTYSYNIALKNALRQAPDVLFIGEIRDKDSMESALTFSETGHLVVATIHANNTSQTIERILTFYPEESYHQVLTSLSHTLNAVLGQRLVRNTSSGLSLAHEILINEGLVKELIKEGKVTDIKEVMKQNLHNGMMTFDECLFKLIKDKVIDKDTAIKEADNPNNLKLKLSQYSESNLVKSLAGVPQTSLKEDQASAYTLRKNKDENNNF